MVASLGSASAPQRSRKDRRHPTTTHRRRVLPAPAAIGYSRLERARSSAHHCEATMKLANVETQHGDGGWRPWTFVRIETDDGLVGWGECSDNRSPYGIAGCVHDMEDLLIGQDPRPIERLYWDMLRRTRQNLGGVTHKAI